MDTALKASQFPKQCTNCNDSISLEKWNTLPPAAGGLYALGMEWRNCVCDGTLVVGVEKDEDFDESNTRLSCE